MRYKIQCNSVVGENSEREDMFSFFNVLVVVISVLQPSFASCPNGCNCSDTQLLCLDQKLERVPTLALLDNAPQVIDLSGNKLTYIGTEDFSFERNDVVQEMYLNNSEIVHIEKGAFEELENLQELYLGQNLLNSVSEFIIEPLDSVVVLDLSNNYFSGDMPVIRSKSLEVLAMANSKVSTIPKDALKHLPNLKVLLLQQNNIKTISLEVFDAFKENSLFINLSHNPMDCGCDNFNLFQMLDSKKFIDTSEPYRCTLENGTFVDIFGKNGVFNGNISECEQKLMKRNLVTKELSSEFSDFKEVRAMVNEENSEKDHLLRLFENENKTKIFRNATATSENLIDKTVCQDLASLFLVKFRPENRFFVGVLIAIVLSFFIGLLTGILFIKILFGNRYQKLAQDSESTSKLVFES